MLPRALLAALTVVITIAWAANVVIGFLVPDRHDSALNAIFAVVIGSVYALGSRDPRRAARAARRRVGRLIAGDQDDNDREDEDDES